MVLCSLYYIATLQQKDNGSLLPNQQESFILSECNLTRLT